VSQTELKANVARKALKLCIDRIGGKSKVALPEILDSIQVQLEWLVSYFEGESDDRDKLGTLVFGHYAAREIDERDKEFVDSLFNAAYVADQTARGLKIDLKVIENDS
jgi:hypothetical protein